MRTKRTDNIEQLLSKLNKEQLCNFIREEYYSDNQFQQCFLALGAGTIFHPKSIDYKYRVISIIENFEGRDGYVKYEDTFALSHSVYKILDEAEKAIKIVEELKTGKPRRPALIEELSKLIL